MINSLLNDDEVRGHLKTDPEAHDTAPVSDRSDKVVVSINRVSKDVQIKDFKQNSDIQSSINDTEAQVSKFDTQRILAIDNRPKRRNIVSKNRYLSHSTNRLVAKPKAGFAITPSIKYAALLNNPQMASEKEKLMKKYNR